jgi:glycosyltransferase involved in cell wall biosynthesis
VGKYTKILIDSLKKYDQNNEYIFCSRTKKLLNKVDLIHYPYFDLFFLTLPIYKRTKTIVTIHDVIPLVFTKNYPVGLKGYIKFQLQKFSLKNVVKVITDSEQSKNDISKYLGVSKDKINVVYLSADPIFRSFPYSEVDKVVNKYRLPKQFVLYVGDVNYNKNIPNLLKAIKKIGCNIVLVGKAFLNNSLPETKNIQELILNLKLENKIQRLGYISDQELCALYNAASICVQPSLYEGFSLPVVEAMACGGITVCSDIPVHNEVAGDEAFYFNPKNVDNMVKALTDALSLNGPALKSKKEKNVLQSKKFTWEKTIKETIKIYNEVLR